MRSGLNPNMFSVSDPLSQYMLFLTARGYYGDICAKADITLGHLQRAAHREKATFSMKILLNEEDSNNNIGPGSPADIYMCVYSPEMTPTHR